MLWRKRVITGLLAQRVMVVAFAITGAFVIYLASENSEQIGRGRYSLTTWLALLALIVVLARVLWGHRH